MKLLGIGIAVLGITFTACSQDIAPDKVPSVVTNALQAKYASATKIDWEKKNNVYEAEFDQDTVEYTIEIDDSGKILREKQDLTAQQLPAAIAQAITAGYKDFQIEDVEKVAANGATVYQVELDSKARGKKDVKLVFDANGATSKIGYWD